MRSGERFLLEAYDSVCQLREYDDGADIFERFTEAYRQFINYDERMYSIIDRADAHGVVVPFPKPPLSELREAYHDVREFLQHKAPELTCSLKEDTPFMMSLAYIVSSYC